MVISLVPTINPAYAIHIVDAMFTGNLPDSIMQDSWISYLKDILQRPTTKIDLLFNFFPGVNDEQTVKLMRVAISLEEFFNQL